MKNFVHGIVTSGSAMETKTENPVTPADGGSAPLSLEANLCFAIYGAAHAFTRTYKPLLEPLGLTYPQYLVMLCLWEEDGQTVKALGERLGLDSGTLSPLLKRMEQTGFVKRERSREDERQVKIALTDEGKALEARSAGVRQAIGAALGCTMDEAAALRDEVMALKARLMQLEG
jgi:MarR family transcriptional regulator, organic hydroperoxide resistance regulator